MATYKDIQLAVKQVAGFTPKNCWIAHVLSDHGKTSRKAYNRISSSKRSCPCPEGKYREAIEKTLRGLKMI